MRKGSPLHPVLYLKRNLSKTGPLVGVIILAVMLIAGIVSMINSIPLSIKTIYSYSKHYLGLTPRGDASLTPVFRKEIEENSPVEIDRIAVVRGSFIEVRSIVGGWPFAVMAMSQDDMRYYTSRMGVTDIEGRYPEVGEPAVLVSEPMAKNLKIKIGSTLLSPELSEAYSPNEVKVVGIAKTDEWLALASIEYYQVNHFPPVDSLLVFAKNREDQSTLDHWADEEFKGERAQLYSYHKLEEQADTMFSILYQILNVVIGTQVVVVTLMMGMLINIYLSQRIQEFGLLQALGHTKRSILGRVLKETGLVVIGGWILGVLVAYSLLQVVKSQLMDPQAFALNPLDQMAYVYTIPIPVAIFLVAFLTVSHRFRKFDPVGVVERRLL